MSNEIERAPGRARQAVTAVAIGFATLLVVAGVAYAGLAALTTSAVITACKNAATGQIRLVVDSSQCRQYEEVVSWNTEGPPGPQGPPGPPGEGGLSLLEYVTAGPDSASQQAVEAVCGDGLNVVGGAVKNRATPGIVRESHPSNGGGSGEPGARGWYGVVAGGSGPFSVFAICAPAASTEFRSAGGQYGG